MDGSVPDGGIFGLDTYALYRFRPFCHSHGRLSRGKEQAEYYDKWQLIWKRHK